MTTKTLTTAPSKLTFVGKKASTPKKYVKKPRWRGSVIQVVNKTLGYEFISPSPRADQAWYWTSKWQRSVEKSVGEINEGLGTVHDDKGFLAALDDE